MKYLLLTLCVFLFSCNRKENNEPDTVQTPADTVHTAVADTRLLIIPGKSIGNISLEQNAESLDSILGKADLSDAAMGKAWLTWFSKVSDTVTGNELNIYTTYKDNEMREKVVRQVRITSDEFKTADGLATGKSLADIRKVYPEIAKIGGYDLETSNPVLIYDSVPDGIAFETEKDSCTGIIIHEKGKEVAKEYITFHPDMKPM